MPNSKIRIFITGNAGSGKTTLSKQVGNSVGIIPTCLDKIVWQPNWVQTPKSERSEKIATLINNDSWIIDGVSYDVLKAADVVVFLDYLRIICFMRIIKRNWKYLFTSRPELPPKCPEIKIIKRLIAIVWNFEKLVKPQILQHINENETKQIIYHITNKKELSAFLNVLQT